MISKVQESVDVTYGGRYRQGYRLTEEGKKWKKAKKRKRGKNPA